MASRIQLSTLVWGQSPLEAEAAVFTSSPLDGVLFPTWSSAWDRSRAQAVREGPAHPQGQVLSQLGVEATEAAGQTWRGHCVPGEPGPHPTLRQEAHSGPPAPPPSSHPDPARRGDTLGSWGWILHNHQRPHCFPVSPLARGWMLPLPVRSLCLALPAPSQDPAGHWLPLPSSLLTTHV